MLEMVQPIAHLSADGQPEWAEHSAVGAQGCNSIVDEGLGD
ncbi:hypothetical protein CLOSTMETH_01220 [[Clostridium] methylpentosum DSM 5476]|uniref:Uncharacterized protein n=1 Tax=[Clostridium] methylpentosum DSM 5476 TaxID=537013 RepID=C0EBK2_9FIRM|nr:hypothetical protein CLOSTMETH_01220 [[Clostridium] methylpentosum DSM 5476]